MNQRSVDLFLESLDTHDIARAEQTYGVRIAVMDPRRRQVRVFVREQTPAEAIARAMLAGAMLGQVVEAAGGAPTVKREPLTYSQMQALSTAAPYGEARAQAAERLLTAYERLRGTYNNAGDLECLLNEAIAGQELYFDDEDDDEAADDEAGAEP